jgi:deoxyadenosine/deoxycytidine kinase
MNLILIKRYSELQTDEQALQRLTGLKNDEFLALYYAFREEWQLYFYFFTFTGQPRQRKQISVRKNSIFGDSRDALLFVLIYLKGGVLQQELAKAFGIDQPKVSRYLAITQKLLLQVIFKNPNIIPKWKQKKLQDAIFSRATSYEKEIGG